MFLNNLGQVDIKEIDREFDLYKCPFGFGLDQLDGVSGGVSLTLEQSLKYYSDLFEKLAKSWGDQAEGLRGKAESVRSFNHLKSQSKIAEYRRRLYQSALDWQSSASVRSDDIEKLIAITQSFVDGMSERYKNNEVNSIIDTLTHGNNIIERLNALASADSRIECK